MLPYFKYTEDVQSFCLLMGYTIDLPRCPFEYVCTYPLDAFPTPIITAFNLDCSLYPLIPPEKVLEYLTLILNGYSFNEAIKELGVVGNGRSSSS